MSPVLSVKRGERWGLLSTYKAESQHWCICYNVGSKHTSSKSALLRYHVNLNAGAVIARDARILSEIVGLPKKKRQNLKRNRRSSLSSK